MLSKNGSDSLEKGLGRLGGLHAQGPSCRIAVPAASQCGGGSPHVRFAEGTQAELVDAGRVFTQQSGGPYAGEAAYLFHKAFQIFLRCSTAL